MPSRKRKLPSPDQNAPDASASAASTSQITSLHDVSYPKGWRPPPAAAASQSSTEQREPAMRFSFPLDPFQSDAIECVEKGETVMVSAHTSAGKTVVALYTIAMCIANNQRVIYTSPIKALSNQKYRDFKLEFGDVGLMTGDVTIEPDASCLVMTTEIWRSMQYKGSELMREVAWIVFDEVHYMRDRERGVVWEESIVMAPKNARFVFLSATVPNAKEFADWVAKVHQQPCHIVYTDYRPVPLEHYVFPAGAEELYMVVDEKGKFLETSFQKSLNALARVNGGGKESRKKERRMGQMFGKTGEESDIFRMVKMIMQRQYDPVILFCFSKRECEFLALQMTKMDLNDESQKDHVENVFNCAMYSLSEDDKNLPQVTNMLPILKRGIGVHHSGLLPILKEVIELLFEHGLIKCLFATETFSIGLNMPVKTVVFTNVRKFDGDKFRWLSSGEYIQMSGRAGRRGIDVRGICILMMDEKMEPSTAKMMLKGSTDPLNSAFHLSYNMLLNQMISEDGDPENLLRDSFYQFQADRSLPDLEKHSVTLESERDSIIIEEEESVKDYYNLLQQYNILKNDIRNIIFSPKYCLNFLQPGRLLRIIYAPDDKTPYFLTKELVTWGVIFNFEKVKAKAENRKLEDGDYTINVLTRCTIDKGNALNEIVKVVPLCGQGEAVVVSLPLSQIDRLSVIRLQQMPNDLLAWEVRENTLHKVSEVCSRFAKDGIPLLDPEEDMKIQSNDYKEAIKKIEALDSLFDRVQLQKAPLIQKNLMKLHEKYELTKKIRSIKNILRSSTALAFKDELKARKRVLRRMGYTTSEDVVTLKGKVAREITCADELTLTELMFSGILKDASVEAMIALLSCFVWQEKIQDAMKPREELNLLFLQLQDTARRVANVQIECKVQIDVESFVSSFRPDIMESVYAWAKGLKFYDIVGITKEVFEGSLVRAIRRLEEVLQQLILASKAIGETQLESKFEEAVSKIKRDIVFAASLYL